MREVWRWRMITGLQATVDRGIMRHSELEIHMTAKQPAPMLPLHTPVELRSGEKAEKLRRVAKGCRTLAKRINEQLTIEQQLTLARS